MNGPNLSEAGEKVGQFRRIIRFYPAYDKRKEGYGVHGVDLCFYLVGEKGTVQFMVFTNWHLPHVQKELEGRVITEPLPADLGYHSPKPRYEGQEPISDTCKWVGGGPCYYDGSGLRARDVFKRLLEEGDAGVWAELEAFYREVFEGKEVW